MGVLLIAAAASGYLLGGCAGDGLEGLSGATELPSVALPEVTVPEVTLPTVPDVTVPTLPDLGGDTTAEAPTTEAPTTVPEEPTTTNQPPITTEGVTTTIVETETATVTATVPTETAVAAPTLAETTPVDSSSDDDNLWAWIALAVGLLVAAGILAYVLWKRRRDEGKGGP
jgi:hypothetical protein